MRILLATDAWEPQVNGVVRTLTRTVAECREMGHEVEVISPDQFKTFPLPTYPEIKLAVGAYEPLQEKFKSFEPEAIHIATEGPIGFAARRICLDWKLPFTTSYHTKFPEYVAARLPLPVSAGYAYMRWFHKPSGRLMVATPTMRDELAKHGFRNISPWSRGVDTELFHPDKRGHPDVYAGLDRPDLAERRADRGREEPRGASRSGPAGDQGHRRRRAAEGRARRQVSRRGLPRLEVRRGAFRLLRRRRRLRLPIAHRHLRHGDPGGHGLRHAGRRLPGARTRSTSSPTPASGRLAETLTDGLREACLGCLDLDRDAVRAYAERFSWRASADEFVRNLQPYPEPEKTRFWRRLRRLARLRRRPAQV